MGKSTKKATQATTSQDEWNPIMPDTWDPTPPSGWDPSSCYMVDEETLQPLSAYSELVRRLRYETGKTAEILSLIKKELIRLLRDKGGCKPPRYKPAKSMPWFAITHRVYVALCDVRQLQGGKGNTIATTLRMAELGQRLSWSVISPYAHKEIQRQYNAADALAKKHEAKYGRWEEVVLEVAKNKPDRRGKKTKLCEYASNWLQEKEPENYGDTRTILKRLNQRNFTWP